MRLKKIFIISLFTLMLVSNVTTVYASSGRLKKGSIKTCNGVTYGQHSSDNHWHVASENSDGSYSAVGNAMYTDPCGSSSDNNTSGNTSNNNQENNSNESSNTENKEEQPNNTVGNNAEVSNNKDNNTSKEENKVVVPVEPKSNDNTLKVVKINGSQIELSNSMSYTTTEKEVKIVVETNDSKATYKVKNNENLSIGDNDVVIEVTAENGDIKTYNIKVNRKMFLSSNTDITIKIDGEDVTFSDNKATFYVGSTTKTIEFDYELSDEKSKVDMDKIETLKTGDNIIMINVTAEDGTKEEYELNIYKYNKIEEITSTITSFAILGGMGYGIYYFVKKKKK